MKKLKAGKFYPVIFQGQKTVALAKEFPSCEYQRSREPQILLEIVGTDFNYGAEDMDHVGKPLELSCWEVFS